jgi:pilus assembly protein Flp/PilA|tara:strand:- start:75 stop:284 length:210 start_codon:yes stop_codon:yes gene_type:complete
MSGPQRIDFRLGAALRRLAEDEQGATAMEYAMIASLLSVAIVGSALMLGGGLEDLWAYVRDEVMAGLAL